MIWLVPIAIMVDRMFVSGLIGLLIAYLPLVILAIGLKAGIAR